MICYPFLESLYRDGTMKREQDQKSVGHSEKIQGRQDLGFYRHKLTKGKSNINVCKVKKQSGQVSSTTIILSK